MKTSTRTFLTVIFAIVYALLLGYMIKQSLASGESSAEESGRIVSYLVRFKFFAKLFASGELDELVRKFIGHFCEYGLLGIAGYFLFYFAIGKPLGQVFSLALGVISCVATETAQIFTQDRAPSFVDVLVDFQGYATAFLILCAIFLSISLIRRSDHSAYIRYYLYGAPFIAATIVPYVFIKDLSLGKVACYCVFLAAFTIVSVFILVTRFIKPTKKPLY